MFDTFIEGPDATRLLSEVSANNYENFAIGQAKQFVPVTAEGQHRHRRHPERTGEQAYTLSGIPAAQNWVKYHGETGGYDVAFVTDPSSAFRGGANPALFRYQVQGPLATELVETVFGGPLPPSKFFHSVPVELDGMRFRALRHNMAGQDGYEFIGPWEHAAAVKETLLGAGEAFGLVHVGALAYASAVGGERLDPVAGARHLHRPRARRLPRLAAAVRHRGAAAAERQLLLRGHRGLLPVALRARLRPVDLLQPRLHRPGRAASGRGHGHAHQGHRRARPGRRRRGAR